MNLGIVFVLWRGGYMAVQGNLEIGKIMAFVNYLVQITQSLMIAINLFVNISRARASAERITELFATEPSLSEPEHPVPFSGTELEFREVSFTYPGGNAPTLKNISCIVKPGETVGIIGATGSGKTTLASLIPRLYDATEGQVLLGGTDIRTIAASELHQHIGIVMQEATIFSGTVRDNLLFGNPLATDDDCDLACTDAQGYDFLHDSQTGYEKELEQRGRNLSGGQKQRLSIARTLVRNPDILILDDSTSAVDLGTEARMRAAIKNRMSGKSLVIIAQRISVVMNADRIIVLDDGHIAGSGTHQELVASNEIYRSIVASQLGEEAVWHLK
jgi:ATP-binding cassette subfamily B protein